MPRNRSEKAAADDELIVEFVKATESWLNGQRGLDRAGKAYRAFSPELDAEVRHLHVFQRMAPYLARTRGLTYDVPPEHRPHAT